MKNILFITDTALANPKRGTPLRIMSVAKQINKENNIFVVAQDVSEDLSKNFVVYPKINFFSKILFFVKLIKKNKIDLVFANTDIEIILPVFLKIFTRVKIAIDIHGLYAEEMYYANLIGPLKKRLIDFTVRICFFFYDLIFVCSHKLIDYYPQVSKKMLVLYGGFEGENIFDTKERIEPEVFTIGYAGNLKSYQGFDYVLEACSIIKQKNLFDFKLNLIVSSGTTDIEKKLNDYGLLEVSELSFKVEYEEAKAIIGRSSVLVIPRPSLPLTEYAFPSKMPGDLLSGIPTIITIVGPVEKLLGNSDVSILINPDNITVNLVDALLKVKNMSSEERGAMSNRAKKFVQANLTWDVLGAKINEVLKNL